MTITKHHRKILAFVYKHRRVSCLKIRKHIRDKRDLVEILEKLVTYKYLSVEGDLVRHDGNVNEISDRSVFEIADLGAKEVEAYQWFDSAFVIRNILLPIALSIITTLLTQLIQLLI